MTAGRVRDSRTGSSALQQLGHHLDDTGGLTWRQWSCSLPRMPGDTLTVGEALARRTTEVEEGSA